MANDNDPDGNAIFISSVTQPAFGTVSVNVDSTLVTYFPARTAAAFTYTITDVPPKAEDALSDTARVTVLIVAAP